MRHFMINYNHVLDRWIWNKFYMDCDSFVLSIETQNKRNDWENVDDLFDFSILNENHELFSNRKKKL